ncbi:MAG: dTMP kinase [Thermoplasmata archaeon]
MIRDAVRRAWYVAFEGIDGAGKSTVVRRVASRLRRDGLRVVTRKEPASAELNRKAQAASVQDPWTGAVYFTLDRYLARTDLERDLRHASVVLSDRSYWSTLAYQGSALAPERRRTLGALQSQATVEPDQVILIDLDPAEAMRRVGSRASAKSPLERRQTLQRVARAYRRFARQNGWLVLDAQRPAREIADGAARSIRAELAARHRIRARRRS